MLYIHHTTCISPQQSFGEMDIKKLNTSVNNKLHAIEPAYQGIPPGSLRRMGKAVRIGVGAALPLFKHTVAGWNYYRYGKRRYGRLYQIPEPDHRI